MACENVYFVVSKNHLARHWPELLDNPRPFDPDILPEHRLTCGVDGWLLVTWARLCAAQPSFHPVLTTRAPDNAVAVFHYDTALPSLGVHRCFAVVVQADRPRPALADLVIRQNEAVADDAAHVSLPYWPQPGLLERDPARENNIRHLAYFGSRQYVPAVLQDPLFRQKLEQAGLTFECRFRGSWQDYRNTDLVIALRDSPPVVLATKPASKLINAWTAGVPALLGPEPAYRALRRSPLDYIEVSNGEDILSTVAELRAKPELYAAMRANGKQRSAAFSATEITKRWIAVLEEALERNRSLTRRNPLRRRLRYTVMHTVRKVQSRLAGWKD